MKVVELLSKETELSARELAVTLKLLWIKGITGSDLEDAIQCPKPALWTFNQGLIAYIKRTCKKEAIQTGQSRP